MQPVYGIFPNSRDIDAKTRKLFGSGLDATRNRHSGKMTEPSLIFPSSPGVGEVFAKIMQNKLIPVGITALMLPSGSEIPSYVDGGILPILETVIKIDEGAMSKAEISLLCDIIYNVRTLASLNLSPRITGLNPALLLESKDLISQCNIVLDAYA